MPPRNDLLNETTILWTTSAINRRCFTLEVKLLLEKSFYSFHLLYAISFAKQETGKRDICQVKVTYFCSLSLIAIPQKYQMWMQWIQFYIVIQSKGFKTRTRVNSIIEKFTSIVCYFSRKWLVILYTTGSFVYSKEINRVMQHFPLVLFHSTIERAIPGLSKICS